MFSRVALGAGLSSEVLLALLDVAEVGVTGAEVQHRLKQTGKTPRADKLMVSLLRLEDTGHVRIDRQDGLRFALTPKGRDRAYELGGGQPVHVQLLMADLVSFTEFTSVHGDAAARAIAGTLHHVASDAVRRERGEVVKVLGDGFLAWLPPGTDPMGVLRAVTIGCEHPSGQPWLLHAASHVGSPISHGGDLFGADVNLVSRLCDAAGPGELVRSAGGEGAPERLQVRGFDTPIPVWRVAIA
jgi:class 3 adenylate cyclase